MASDWAPHKWDRKQCQEGEQPIVYERDMMGQIEAHCSRKSSSLPPCCKLPQVIVKPDTATLLFPERGPLRKIGINEMNIWIRLQRHCSLNLVTIVLPGYHPCFIGFRNSLAHIPSNPRLRS